jgi:hypothetical protein
MDEAQLLEHCRWEAFRASGPGGQKRNKTSSAIRITHEATGIAAIANESRSQHENRHRALRRLRHRLAIELRRPVDLAAFLPPEWLKARILHGRLTVSTRHQDYPQVLGLILDVLHAAGWSVSSAAAVIGISTAALVQFLQNDSKLWAEVNRQRQRLGLRHLVQ